MLSFVRRRLSLKLLIPLCLVIVAGIGGLVWYVTQSTFGMAYDEAVHSAQEQAVSAARSLGIFVKDQRAMARMLSRNPDMLAAVQGAPEAAQDACATIVGANPTLWGVEVFDAEGQVKAGANSSDVKMVGLFVASRRFAKEVLKGNDTGVMDKTIVSDRKSGAHIFSISYPIRDPEGQVLGGVVLFCSWDAYVEQFVAPVTIGKAGYGFVLDGDGRFIRHPDETQFRKDASGFEFVKRAMDMKQGVVEYDWEGDRKVMAVATEPVTGWLVCMSDSVDDIASVAVRQGEVMKLTGAGLILVVMVLVHLLLTMFVFRPVKKTVAMAEATAHGDLAQTYDKNENGDEIAGMQSALIDIRRTVRAMTQDFAEVAKRIERGHFTARGDADGFEGEFSRLIKGTNYMLDDMVNLLDELPLPLMAISRDHSILFMNKAGTALGGVEREELVGTTCSDYFLTGDCNPDKCACDRAMRGREMVFSNTEAHPGARSLEIDYFGMPLLAEDGEVLGAVKIIMDQTEIRRVQREMYETATQADSVASMLSAASQELAAQVEQTTRGAERQQAMSADVASAMEEMNATVIEIARNAANAARNAEQMRANAVRGGEAVTAVVDSIELLRGRAGLVDQNIRELGSEVQAIGAIMTVISDIADQTNLLALNAAIEAARAGDAGRGFAVVADEVRKLAEKTMNATQEVGGAIKSIQDGTRRNLAAFENATEAIDQSTELASKAGEALEDILKVVKVADDQIRGIATASEEQAAATSEVGRSVEEVNTVSSEIAGAMTESSSAVGDLARLAEELKQITTRVGGEDGV
ncbi:methyl-accepting chemotaxis sensory transducer with Cache sensor [Pseudodesulfovibrio mercurii]|uniref:Methyl-accepting chemotaxis sensory transducer with Cache sensor n=1 Tax=Pseudodesulfovibrio mercurii TaxID=641491 RepID=F0JE02_9BACT|nr:methyl-accepting chemotaxis protein [Pseudodesulfovibrio mercurii]EGB13442.1 methyl-accepting chemotaxis sensory transducer with Cache sensor [Pseudodesulfovibrio mercurii]